MFMCARLIERNIACLKIYKYCDLESKNATLEYRSIKFLAYWST